MDLSIIILAGMGSAIILGLVFCFFGYKLGRLLFPLSGLIIIEGLIYIYVYKQMQFDTMGAWLLFGGSGIAVYIILFFVKRIAGFFTGFLGGALFALYITNAFGLQNVGFIVPAIMTVSIVSGLLTAVYQRNAVIVFTSLFGACAAAFAGIYIYIQGVDASMLSSAGLIAAFRSFLSANAVFIAGASAGITASGILIQSALTASTCILEGKAGGSRDRSGGLRPSKQNAFDKPAKEKKSKEESSSGGMSGGYFNI